MDLIADYQSEHFECKELVTAEELMDRYADDRPDEIAIDTESPIFYWWIQDCDPFAMTVSWDRDHTYYVNVRDPDRMLLIKNHYVFDPKNHRIRQDVARAAKTMFDETGRVIFHNAKYDIHVLKRMWDAWNLPLVERRVDDTMLMSPILNEHRYHGLKELCVDLSISYDGNEKAADEMKRQIEAWRISQGAAEGREVRFDEVPPYLMVPYAIRDAYMTLELFHRFDEEMDRVSLPQNREPHERDLRRIYETELETMWVLFWAEERGIRVDLDFVHQQIAELKPLIAQIRMSMTARLGWDMNPGSSDDVLKALVQEGAISADDGKRKFSNQRTGKAKLPEWVLSDIDHEFARSVLDYRTAQKMLSSYFEHLADSYRLDELGQAIVRCNNKQMGARTGRMSITEPALQTIPREKGNVRGAFIARDGYSLIFIDYEGEELRVLGHFLAKIGDESMKRVFEEGLDLHQEAASVIFKMPYDEVSKHGPNKWMRDKAKDVNFAIVYGAGQAKLASMLGVTLDEAKIMLRGYYNRFPGIWNLKKKTETAMKQRGYVVTPFGRRHRELNQRFAYKAVNSLIQGSSADVNKSAMVKVRRRFLAEELDAHVLLQIHDELMAEAKDEQVETAALVMAAEMKDFSELEVPLGVDVAIAKRWSDAK